MAAQQMTLMGTKAVAKATSDLIEALADEVQLLADMQASHPSERLLVFLWVMLQKKHGMSHTPQCSKEVKRRLQQWREGKYDLLVQEAESANKHYNNPDKRHSTAKETPEVVIRRYAQMIADGQARKAVRYVTEREGKGGVLGPDDPVVVDKRTGETKPAREVLLDKHPEGEEPGQHAMPSYATLPELPWVSITEEHIEKAARQLQGSAGPGGANGEAWQMWLVRCGEHSLRLRRAVAAVASMMANKTVPWEHIRALMANRLIALDKCPGLRPIGVGECLRRVIGKTVMQQSWLSLKEECGPGQLASNLEGG